MSLLSLNLPGLIHANRHAVNSFYPEDAFYSSAIAAQNHVLAYRRKPLFKRTVPLGTSGGTSGVAWRWHCKTGYAARRFQIVAVLGIDDHATADDPYIVVELTKSGGSPVSVQIHAGASQTTGTDAPDEWVVQTRYIDCDPASVYTGTVEFVDDVRVISLLVFEEYVPTVDESVDYFSEWMPGAASPVFDGRVSPLLAGTGGILRLNRGLRADWCHASGTARTRTSATLINLIDDATTGTPSAASPGWTFHTQYRATVAKAQVPIVAAVYGSIAAGSGTFKLRDTSGNDAVTVTINNATPQWFTAAGALTLGTAVKYDPIFAGDGTHQVSILAACFYEAQ